MALATTTFQAALRALNCLAALGSGRWGSPRFQEASSGLRSSQGEATWGGGTFGRDVKAGGWGGAADQPDGSDRGDLKVGPRRCPGKAGGASVGIRKPAEGAQRLPATAKPPREPGPGGTLPQGGAGRGLGFWNPPGEAERTRPVAPLAP